MSIVFSYKTKKISGEKSTLRPYAEVFLTLQGQKVAFDFLVDSGADRTVVNHELGRVLGFRTQENERPIKLGGVGGFMDGYSRPLSLIIGDIEIATEVIWIHSDRVPLLLGQQDVFDRFDITFSKIEGKIIFAPRD